MPFHTTALPGAFTSRPRTEVIDFGANAQTSLRDGPITWGTGA